MLCACLFYPAWAAVVPGRAGSSQNVWYSPGMAITFLIKRTKDRCTDKIIYLLHPSSATILDGELSKSQRNSIPICFYEVSGRTIVHAFLQNVHELCLSPLELTEVLCRFLTFLFSVFASYLVYALSTLFNLNQKSFVIEPARLIWLLCTNVSLSVSWPLAVYAPTTDLTTSHGT